MVWFARSPFRKKINPIHTHFVHQTLDFPSGRELWSSLKSLSLGIFVGWIRFYLCSWIQHIKLGVENFYSIPQPRTHHRYPFKWPAVQDPTSVRLALLRMPVGRGHLWCQTSRGAICYLSTWKSSPKRVGFSLYWKPPVWEKLLMKSPIWKAVDWKLLNHIQGNFTMRNILMIFDFNAKRS